MNNNDILRRTRFIFDFDDAKMIALFALADQSVTRHQISNWLKKDDDPAFELCPDRDLAVFLNGLINDLRGKKEGPQPEPETVLTNNLIFMKFKIALKLQAEEILELLKLGGYPISKHELSGFFRKPDHRNYRPCKDQVLRYFLKGLQVKHRPKP